MTPGSRVGLTAGTLLVVAGLSFGLRSYPLLDPDEGRNAEVAREMAASNDYLIPTLDRLPYADKPAVFFAADALAMRLLGPTVFAARLVPLLFTLGTLTVVWWFGRRLFGDETGWIAAIATGASPLTLAFARTVIFDSALTFFVVVALVGFYIAAEETVGRQTVWSPLAWAAMALGVLTKGPIALAVPLMIAIPYLVWRRAWKILVDPVGLLLFLALVLPWARYMSDHVPGYLRYVLVTETFHRLTTNELQRTGPWWYFLPILFCGALPWSVAALTIRRLDGQTIDSDPTIQPSNRPTVYLLLWIVVPLLFFSLSQSKRPQYVLPLVPAITLLLAGRWTQRSARIGALAVGIVGLTIIATQGLVPRYIHGITPQVAAAIPALAISLGLICVVAGLTAFWWNARRDIAILALSLPVLLTPVLSGRLTAAIGHDRSAEDLAASIGAALSPETEIVGIRAYPPSLPFYLNRTITLSTDSATELTSNYIVRHLGLLRTARNSPLRPADWWREAAVDCERPRIFVVAGSDRETRAFLAGHLPLIADAGRYAAYGPCGLNGLASIFPQRRSPSAAAEKGRG